MRFLLPLLILIMGVIYIFDIGEDWQTPKVLFKLIPMALIILYAYLQSSANRKRFHWTVIVGLVFCAIGDGTLRWFVVGLSAFLIGHLFYMSGFFSRRNPTKPRIAAIAPIALYAVFMGWKMVNALLLDGKGALIVPVLLYIAVISLMTWSAILTGNKWAIAGSILFMISDSILSWNMFVSDVANSGILIMTTYYGAQFLIAHSLRTVTLQTRSSVSLS